MSNTNEILNTEQLNETSGTAAVSGSDADIFKEVFGGDTDGFVAKMAENPEPLTQSEPAEVPVVNNQKEDPAQFQYWQSQADKKTQEVDALRKELEELKSKASTPSQPAPEVPAKQIVEKPTKPVKPADFDNSEALTDPNSKSAKYLADRERYLDDMTEYLMEQENVRNEISEKQIAEQRKLNSQQQLVSDLQAQYQYTPEQAADFVKTMSSPDSLSLDNLVKLHKALSSTESENIPVAPNVIDPRASEMAQRQQKLNIPKPISTQPSVNMQSSKKVEDKMMDSMIANYQKKNPF